MKRDEANPTSLFSKGPDRSSGRVVSYILLGLILLVAAVLTQHVGTVTTPVLHTLFELVATLLAFVVGALALVRFYSRRRSTYLFIGTGFLGTAILDGYHTVVTSPFLWEPVSVDAHNLMAWTWVASRVFLSLFLFVSWLAWHQESAEGKDEAREGVDEHSVYVTAGFLTTVIFAFFAWSPLSDAYYPEWFLSRPAEIIPGLFFLLALAGYLWKGEWRRDPFEHWLVLALIISVFTHFGFLVFSGQQFDARADAAHFLKIASYAAVLVGLMASVFVTFRREEEASTVILRANAALAQEIRIRREAEHVLQESEERLQDFLDHANDLFQSTAPDGRILYVNDAWKRTLGYEGEDVEGMNILEVIAPDSRDAYRTEVKRVFEGASISDLRISFLAKDGSRIVCSGSSNCRFENGRPVATRTIFRNVTEEIRAERELERSKANLQALFESTGDAIWSVDGEHRLITFNTAYALTVEAITGRAPQVGDPLEKVVTPGEIDWFQGCYDRALAGTRFSAVRDESVDRQVRNFELFFNPIDSGSGAEGVVVFSKDITRRRRVEEALRRAKQEAEEGNRAKSQFMANMSHELRTPLNSVIGFANILLKDPQQKLNTKETGFLDRILANGKHLLNLINEILDLSKIEAGRMELELESVELPRLIRETLGQLEGQVAGRPVELRGDWGEGLAPLQTDPGKLRQVLINLVGNALKFTEKGEVVVEVQTAFDGRTPERLLVRDTGIGIPQERLDAIFEAFQQADGTTTRRFGGTGLGLTISRSLCGLMGYDLTVGSEVGEGSTFTIHLTNMPREDDEEIGELFPPPTSRWAAAGPEARSELRGKKVLVVDDEADSRTLLTHYLEEMECTVVTAVDGVDGLETARREAPDLITVDLMMPRMSGWEMLRAIRDDPVLRDVPIVVVSIVAEEGTGEVLGAVDLLTKPVDREELASVLRRNLATTSGRVLIVDDNPDTRLILQRYLKEAGLVPHAAEDGKAALELLRRIDVDLVLLDLLMPEMDGFTALAKLRKTEKGADLPVVVLTAKELTQAERELLERHAAEVIPKGLEVETSLRSSLDRIFGRSRESG